MMATNNIPDQAGFDFAYCSDKTKVFENYCRYMFTRTQSMFVYEGLPDSIPVMWLEKYLQQYGSCCIAEHEGKLYALRGDAGGEYDEYYQPTLYTVANPFLKLSKTYKIGEDCVYCKNDYDALGLMPLICRYAGLMTENLLTVRLADINMRMMNLLSAPDDNTLQSTKQYLKDLEAGKLGVVGETPFFDGLKLQSKSVGNGDYMIQFIELQQYLKGSLYNELGINANFNMKREALSGQELAMNDDALMPLIDDMLKQRRALCDAINEMFGLDVSVDYGSTWHSNVIEKQLVGQEELGANEEGSTEMAGDETALPDNKDPNAVDEPDGNSAEDDVSQLNSEESDSDADDTDAEDDTSSDDDSGDSGADEQSEADDSDTDADDSGSSDEQSGDEEPAEEDDKSDVEEESSDDEEPAEEDENQSEEEKPVEDEKKKEEDDEDETD